VNALGERTDTDGQFLCEDMPEVMAFARRYRKTLVPVSFGGRDTAQPPLTQGETTRMRAASTALRERLDALDPRDPAIAALSVADWLERQPDAEPAKAAFRSMIEGLWCLSADEVPLWYLIDNDRRITNEVTELQYYLRETMHGLAEDLAAGLDIRVNSAVTGIRHDKHGAVVAAGTASFLAGAVLLAIPPSCAVPIAFAPPLSDDLQRAQRAWTSGSVLKAGIRYPRRFWRDDGRSGVVMWRDPVGLFACDTSPDDHHPALTFFAGGPIAHELGGLDDAVLRAAITDLLVEALGPEAASWSAFDLRSWMAPLDGGYSDIVTDITALHAEDVLRAGAPPLHFASSELSPSFPGYVEGAIVAGRLAAERLLAGMAAGGQSAIATSASGS